MDFPATVLELDGSLGAAMMKSLKQSSKIVKVTKVD